jgi:hypothetical protein
MNGSAKRIYRHHYKIFLKRGPSMPREGKCLSEKGEKYDENGKQLKGSVFG